MTERDRSTSGCRVRVIVTKKTPAVTTAGGYLPHSHIARNLASFINHTTLCYALKCCVHHRTSDRVSGSPITRQYISNYIMNGFSTTISLLRLECTHCLPLFLLTTLWSFLWNRVAIPRQWARGMNSQYNTNTKSIGKLLYSSHAVLPSVKSECGQ